MYRIEFKITKDGENGIDSTFRQNISESTFKFLTSDVTEIWDEDENLISGKLIRRTEDLLEQNLDLRHEIYMDILKNTLGLRWNEINDFDFGMVLNNTVTIYIRLKK